MAILFLRVAPKAKKILCRVGGVGGGGGGGGHSPSECLMEGKRGRGRRRGKMSSRSLLRLTLFSHIKKSWSDSLLCCCWRKKNNLM